MVKKHEKKQKHYLGRKRLRYVDFMQIESEMRERPLSAFELHVREKLMASPSPFEVIMRREERRDQNLLRSQARMKLRSLAKKAGLTKTQTAMFELAFMENLPDFEISVKLSVTANTVRWHKQKVLKLLRLAAQIPEENILPDKNRA